MTCKKHTLIGFELVRRLVSKDAHGHSLRGASLQHSPHSRRSTDILFEALRFSTRHTLDAVQLVSRALRDAVGKSASLPLRYIGYAWLNECSGKCFINGLTDGHKELDQFGDYEVPSHYPRTSSVAFEFSRQTSCVNNNAGAIQHDLVAFVAQKFEPDTYEPQLEWDRGLLSQYITLFDRESLRHSIERLEFQCDSMEVPTFVLPALFNVSKLKECGIQCASNPTAWINGFIQIFEQAEGELCMVTSVTIILNEGYSDAWHPDSVVHAPPRLVHPAQTDLLPPRTAFLDKLLAEGLWCDEEARRTQSKCELYVFTNTLMAKRLHVYRWIVYEEEEAGIESLSRIFHHEVTHVVVVDV